MCTHAYNFGIAVKWRDAKGNNCWHFTDLLGHITMLKSSILEYPSISKYSQNNLSSPILD